MRLHRPKKIITWKKIIELQYGYATSQEEHLPRTTPTCKPQKFGPILVSPLPPPLIRHFNQIAEQNVKRMGPQPTSQPANQSRYRSRGCWLFLIWIKTKREGSRLHLGTRFTLELVRSLCNANLSIRRISLQLVTTQTNTEIWPKYEFKICLTGFCSYCLHSFDCPLFSF